MCEAVLNNEQITATVDLTISGNDSQICFPVKHINVNPGPDNWQIETGPVLVYYNNPEPALLPAYLVINNLGNADLAPLLSETNSKSRFYQKNHPKSQY